MAISKRLRYEIMRRDNYACRYCGARAPDVALTVDHVIPAALGGTDEAGNLVTACHDCNAGKASSNPDAPLVDDVEQDALRWSRAMEHAAELQSRHRQEFVDYCHAVEKKWSAYLVGRAPEMVQLEDDDLWRVRTPSGALRKFSSREEAHNFYHACDARRPVERPDDWQISLRRFFELGLEVDVVVGAIDDAMAAPMVLNKNVWRYMCGICWRILDERQDIARELLTTDEDADGT